MTRPNPDHGKTQLEILREMRADARATLEGIKDHDLTQWTGESDDHFKARKERHHDRRKNARKIYEGLDARVAMAAKRKEERREKEQADHNPYDAHGGGIVTFDGKQVVEWIAHDLFEIRKAGWTGYLVSGYRTPEYSTSLCVAMCGAPSCPGRCAGATSNHAKSGDGGGACDLSDYVNAERLFHETGSRLWNDLPVDLVHFSSTGH